MAQQWRPQRQWRDFPYYKIQVFNATTQAWKDIRGAFDTLEEAREHRSEKLQGQESRIVVVEGRRKRHVLEEE